MSAPRKSAISPLTKLSGIYLLHLPSPSTFSLYHLPLPSPSTFSLYLLPLPSPSTFSLSLLPPFLKIPGLFSIFLAFSPLFLSLLHLPSPSTFSFFFLLLPSPSPLFLFLLSHFSLYTFKIGQLQNLVLPEWSSRARQGLALGLLKTSTDLEIINKKFDSEPDPFFKVLFRSRSKFY